jgi:hypothetical protein
MIESFGHATQQQTLADLGIQAGEIFMPCYGYWA